MCSPLVMAKVQTAVSRRGFLGRLGAAGTAAAFGAGAFGATRVAGQEATPTAGQPAGAISLGQFTQIQDLTHVVSGDFPMYPGAKPMQIYQFLTVEANGYYKNVLILDASASTTWT